MIARPGDSVGHHHLPTFLSAIRVTSLLLLLRTSYNKLQHAHIIIDALSFLSTPSLALDAFSISGWHPGSSDLVMIAAQFTLAGLSEMPACTLAAFAALLVLITPYIASLLSQPSHTQRLVASLAIYMLLSGQQQHRSAKRFTVDQQRTTSESKIPSAANSEPSRPRSQLSSPSFQKRSSASRPAAPSGNESSVPEKVLRVQSEQCPQLIDACYLDAAAAPPYPSGLVKAVADELSTKLLSNPHSKSPSAISTADQITSVRLRVMRELFGIQDTHNWHLVFTSGATASLKLVGESFDWKSVASSSKASPGFSYLLESHTSAVGIRVIAARAGVTSSTFSENDDLTQVGASGLVVLPLQCNATGRRYSDLVKRVCRAKRNDTLVMVDAASYLSSSSRLDMLQVLPEETPDMIAFSFYKIFGYPTGLGGLLVKASAAPRLSNKTYFGGGTVDSVLAESRWTKPRKEFEARFEDGTVNIHGIVAVNKALDYYGETFGPWAARSEYVGGLREKLIRAMRGLMHGNGSAVVRFYPENDAEKEFGPIINFNILNSNGSIVPPQEVERLASISNIHLRMGRHCNPGFVTSQLGITHEQLKTEYAEGVGCDDAGADAGLAVSVSLRASLCLLNVEEDVERLIGFIARFFLSCSPISSMHSVSEKTASRKEKRFELTNITVYPVKSCAGQNLRPGQEWGLTRHGLEYDRKWIVMNFANGKALSQKRFPKMALIRPSIDLATRKMTVSIAGSSTSVAVDLEDDSQYLDDASSSISAEVCGAEIRPRAHKCEILRRMLTDLLGVSCTLARQATEVSRHSKLDSGSDKIPLIFSNESPFLMINSASVDKVSRWIQQDSQPALLPGSEELASDSGYSSVSHSLDGKEEGGIMAQAASFRANFLISPPSTSAQEIKAVEAFAEDELSRVVMGGKHVFGVLGECRRCLMVCVDQETGEVKPQTLKALAKYRRNARGRVIFGSHLCWLPDIGLKEEGAKVWVGMEVVAS